MFEGLTLLPLQYHPPTPPTPCQRLAQAMLDDLFTVKDFAQKYPQVRWWQRQRQADEEWLTSAGGVLTFAVVCDLLGLSPDRIRQAYARTS
jgi:hypothetical protein